MPIAKSMLYIFCFLHQTTTIYNRIHFFVRCISFVSYIKPQLSDGTRNALGCCISFVSYIKPQRLLSRFLCLFVVYLLFPTSNHNPQRCGKRGSRLYIFCFLHQTTTRRKEDAFTTSLYIFCFLHQTTTLQPCAYFRHGLYIFCFLHQTTTPLSIAWFAPRCISFVSYIKPQPSIMRLEMFSVVYLLFPTSNHNSDERDYLCHRVVYLLFPTSNHNCAFGFTFCMYVVYLLFPTSNHNGRTFSNLQIYVVYLLFPTSNHNLIKLSVKDSTVVYLLFPTSNHN